MNMVNYPEDFDYKESDLPDTDEINNAISEATEGKYKDLDLIVIELTGTLVIRIGRGDNKRIIITNDYHVNKKQKRGHDNGQNGQQNQEVYH